MVERDLTNPLGALNDLHRAVSDVPWTDHHGRGDPPRKTPDFVQVKFHDGETCFGIRWDWDQNWCWKPGALTPGSIVAYRTLARTALSQPNEEGEGK